MGTFLINTYKNVFLTCTKRARARLCDCGINCFLWNIPITSSNRVKNKQTTSLNALSTNIIYYTFAKMIESASSRLYANAYMSSMTQDKCIGKNNGIAT